MNDIALRFLAISWSYDRCWAQQIPAHVTGAHRFLKDPRFRGLAEHEGRFAILSPSEALDIISCNHPPRVTGIVSDPEQETGNLRAAESALASSTYVIAHVFEC